MTNIFHDRAKFLVQWIEAEGLVRGQVVKTEDDALRLYEHVLTRGPALLEVRKIGSLLRIGNKVCYYKNSANSKDNAIVAIAND